MALGPALVAGTAAASDVAAGCSSIDAANTALWAEFQRRRRMDREQRRQQQSHGSEVRRLLAEVSEERRGGASSPSASPTGPGGQGSFQLPNSPSGESLGISASLVSGASQRKASPTNLERRGQVSEIQQLLLEVQRERELAAVPVGCNSTQGTSSASTPGKQLSPGRGYQRAGPLKPMNAASVARAPRSQQTLARSSSLTRLAAPVPSAPARLNHATATPVMSRCESAPTLDRARQKPSGPTINSDIFAEMKPKYVAYPGVQFVERTRFDSGGWDDRTTCPCTFAGFLNTRRQGRAISPSQRSPSPSCRSHHVSDGNDRTSAPGKFDDFVDRLAAPATVQASPTKTAGWTTSPVVHYEMGPRGEMSIDGL